MSVIDIEGTAMRLRSLVRRADTFGKTRDDILNEIESIIKDLEKSVDKQ
jgi:phage regulator Rha-like protein